MEVDGRVLRVEQATAAGIGGFAVLAKDAILRENEKAHAEKIRAGTTQHVTLVSLSPSDPQGSNAQHWFQSPFPANRGLL